MPTGVILHVLVVICIYAILSIGLNVIMGYGGMFTIAHAALFGVGAYASALLTLRGLPFWVGMLAGVLLAGFMSFLVGLPTLSLTGDYLAVATMGLGEILVSIFKNWDSVTRGPMGLPGIPPATLFGYSFDTPVKFLGLSVAFLAVVYVVAERLGASPFGLVLKATREDEGATQALGKNTYWFKMWGFVVGGAFAGVAGSLYAHYIGYVDPSSFTLWLTFFLWLIIILGGMGNNLGTILAALAFVAIREGLRFVGLPGNVRSAIQQILFGILLMAMTIFKPQGLLPGRKHVTRYERPAKSP